MRLQVVIFIGLALVTLGTAQSIDEVFDQKNQDAGNAGTPGPTIQGNSGTESTCTCVPYYQCNNNIINTDGNGLIDIRYHLLTLKIQNLPKKLKYVFCFE